MKRKQVPESDSQLATPLFPGRNKDPGQGLEKGCGKMEGETGMRCGTEIMEDDSPRLTGRPVVILSPMTSSGAVTFAEHGGGVR